MIYLLCFILLGLIAMLAKITYLFGKLSEKNRLRALMREKDSQFFYPMIDIQLILLSNAEIAKAGNIEEYLYKAGFVLKDILAILNLCKVKSIADLIEKEESRNILKAYLDGINKGFDRCSEIFND